MAPADPVSAQGIATDVYTLRHGSYGTSGVVALQNYYSGVVGGGGILINNGTPNSCDLAGLNGTINSSNLYQITNVTVSGGGSFPNGVFLGMSIPAGNTLNIPAGDTITAFDPTPTHQTINLQNPASGAASGTFNINGDNGGTTLKDNSGYCFTRINSTYGPREWGAEGLSTGDDTIPLQNWLYSVQPHLGDVGLYNVTSPLTCPVNTTIQGPENLDGFNQIPLFGILAQSGFSGSDVIEAYDYCRISGISVDANNKANAVDLSP